MEHLILYKMFYEFCLRFIYNLENPSKIILILLKSENLFGDVNKKLNKLYNKKIKNEVCINSWDQYLELKINLEGLLKKIKEFITNEGGDIQFTYNREVKIYIINFLY